MATRNRVKVRINDTRSTTHVDVQVRIREVMDDLEFPSLNAAARYANFLPGQLHKMMYRQKTGTETITRLAEGWGVRPFVFFMTREEAAPMIQAALQDRALGYRLPKNKSSNKSQASVA